MAKRVKPQSSMVAMEERVLISVRNREEADSSVLAATTATAWPAARVMAVADFLVCKGAQDITGRRVDMAAAALEVMQGEAEEAVTVVVMHLAAAAAAGPTWTPASSIRLN